MLKNIQEILYTLPNIHLISLSLGLFILYFIVKFLISKQIEATDEINHAEKIANIRRLKIYLRLFLLVAIFSLWFSQLQTVFVSLFAFTAAIVLATKEVIMCMTGGMVIRLNKQFSTGDRIEVDGIRGFVIDRAITATKLLEIGPEKNSQQTTGNIITIPNSVFLSKAAINQSYFQNYSIRSFIFSPIPGNKFEYSEQILLEIAHEISQDYLKKAKDSISRFCKKEGIVIPMVEPRVKLLLSENNKARLLLKVPVDNKKVADIEQKIYRDYYNRLTSDEKERQDKNIGPNND